MLEEAVLCTVLLLKRSRFSTKPSPVFEKMKPCMYISLGILYKLTAWVVYVINFVFHVYSYQIKTAGKKRRIVPWELWDIPAKNLIWEFGRKRLNLRLEGKNRKIDNTELFVGKCTEFMYITTESSGQLYEQCKDILFSIKREEKFTDCLLVEKDLAPWDHIIWHQFYTPRN